MELRDRMSACMLCTTHRRQHDRAGEHIGLNTMRLLNQATCRALQSFGPLLPKKKGGGGRIMLQLDYISRAFLSPTHPPPSLTLSSLKRLELHQRGIRQRS